MMQLQKNSELEHRHWNEQLGVFIKMHRKKNGFTLDKLAKECGMNRCTIHHIENNRYSPIFRNVALIFQVLNISIEDFSNYLKTLNKLC